MADQEFDNLDDLQRAMEDHDLEGASKLTPIEYGRMRGIKPQLIYYHLRSHNSPESAVGGLYIHWERCLCNKKVIDVKRADEYFKRGEFDPTYNHANTPEED